MKKIFYGLLILLALVVITFSMVLADSDFPPTDVPHQPPPVETVEPPTAQPPPTETRLPPPTETSVPPPTDTPITPTDEPTPTSPPEETPFSEPTPTVEVDPTPTETVVPGFTVTTEKHKKPTAVETLPVTGGGMPANVGLGMIGIGTVLCVFVILLARRGRNA